MDITPIFFYTGMALNVFVWGYGWYKIGSYIWTAAKQEKKYAGPFPLHQEQNRKPLDLGVVEAKAAPVEFQNLEVKSIEEMRKYEAEHCPPGNAWC